MDREEAVAKFVKENLRALTDRQASRQLVKQLRQTFFERNHLPASARFSNYDVAKKVVGEVLRVKKEAAPESLRQIVGTIPFVNEEVKPEELDSYVAAMRLGATTTATVTLIWQWRRGGVTQNFIAMKMDH